MVITYNELASTMAKIGDIVAGDKNVPGVLFNISKDDVYACYSNGVKDYIQKIEAIVEDGDQLGKIVFNYNALCNIIDVCKPTGGLTTGDLHMVFADNGLMNIKVEKYVSIISSEDEEPEKKVVSTINQAIGWVVPTPKNVKIAILDRTDFSVFFHHENTEEYGGMGIKPITTADWELNADEWNLAELREVFSKLSVESGKQVIVSPKKRCAFVDNTDCAISINISEVKNKMVISTLTAKSIASFLGKVKADSVYFHMIDENTGAITDGENNWAISVRSIKQDNNAIKKVNHCSSLVYTDLITFNREALQGSFYGAKGGSASNKVTAYFDKTDEEFKMVIEVKDTISSSVNTYELIADHFICEDNIGDIKLSLVPDVVYNAANRVKDVYVAFDISVGEDGSKMVRLAGIDLERRENINNEYNIEGSWTKEFMQEHRADMFDITTYFACGKD